MRYVTVDHLRDGMVLANPLLDSHLRTLLREGTLLEDQHIRRINESGYGGVYVEDNLAPDVKYHDVVKFETRVQTIVSARTLLRQVENGEFEKGMQVTKVRQEKIIMPVIEEIIANPKRMMDRIDMKPYEDYAYYHSANVIILSLLVGIEMGLSGTQLYDLGVASLVYDLGNIFVPKEILNKPGKLTPAEYDEIKSHTDKGFQYLREHFDISIEGCMGALHHHENYDGSGYPNGLKKDKISIYGRVIAITDVYDSLTSRRSFRHPMFPSTAMEFIDMNTGTMFDPKVAKAFKNVVASYPSGVTVELTSGVRCLVLGNTPGFGDRPKVRMIEGLSKTPLIADLSTSRLFSGVEVSHTMDI